MQKVIGKKLDFKFISHEVLQKTIWDKVKRSNGKFSGAIAFWGAGAENVFPKKLNPKTTRIVCNLTSGGTNPYVIRRLKRRGADIRQLNTLHAKVYITPTVAIVTSANFSANGLGFEGKAQSAWLEAGYIVRGEARNKVKDWFETLWDEDLQVVEYTDIDAAIIAWKKRKSQLAELNEIAHFDFKNAKNLPLITWEIEAKWKITESAYDGVPAQKREIRNEEIEFGIEVAGKADREWLKPGRWVAIMDYGASNRPKRNMPIRWVYTGRIINGSYVYTDTDDEDKTSKPYGTALAVLEPKVKPPFDLGDRLLRNAIYDTLQIDKYKGLRKIGYTGAWFGEYGHLTRGFWIAVQKRYRALWKERVGKLMDNSK